MNYNPDANSAPAIHLRLLGQPKSGTTWLEAMVFEAARHCMNATECSVVGDRLNQRARRTFELLVSGRRLVFADVTSKHYFPPKQLPGRCPKHATAFKPYSNPNSYREGPCGLPLVWPGKVDWATSIARCAIRCGARVEKPTLNVRWLHIYRDPRSSAQSACYWYEPLASRVPAVLDACVKIFFRRDVAWLKYREAWLAMNPFMKERTTLISYDDALQDPRAALRRVAHGFLRLHLPNSEMDSMLKELTPEALSRADGRYNMHDSWTCITGKRPPALARAIAMAGDQPSTCHREKVRIGTTLPKPSNKTIRWMETVLQSMRFSLLAP